MKRITTVYINDELYTEAKKRGINISHFLEARLKEIINTKTQDQIDDTRKQLYNMKLKDFLQIRAENLDKVSVLEYWCAELNKTPEELKKLYHGE